MPVVKTLELSTAHVSESTNNFLLSCRLGRNTYLPFRVAQHEYGYILILSVPDAHKHAKNNGIYDTMPELIAVVELAIKKDCRYIYFDQDAETEKQLKTFDWQV